MKKILIFFALMATSAVQNLFAQDSTKKQSSPLIISYYSIKDALVSSNAAAAATAAEGFIKTVNTIDKETLKEDTRSSLLKDASTISQTKDLALQREKFATLSSTMFALAKTVKLTAEPIYQQYCPMKKASWLSNNKAIKNPYYGSAMLTCGSVKETL